MVYGAHHVQGHVTDVMSVILCLLWSPGHHHVGIPNSLHLEVDRNNSCYAAAPVDEAHSREGRQTDLEDSVLLAERVKQRVHSVEHGDHLHRSDVTANASKSHDITEKNGHIWEHLRGEKINSELASRWVVILHTHKGNGRRHSWKFVPIAKSLQYYATTQATQIESIYSM